MISTKQQLEEAEWSMHPLSNKSCAVLVKLDNGFEMGTVVIMDNPTPEKIMESARQALIYRLNHLRCFYHHEINKG